MKLPGRHNPRTTPSEPVALAITPCQQIVAPQTRLNPAEIVKQDLSQAVSDTWLLSLGLIDHHVMLEA